MMGVQWAIQLLQVRGQVAEQAGGWCPAYVTSYDPDAFDGGGDVASDPDPRKALRFRTREEATTFYLQTSTVRPVRPDGLPNRPLTAFSAQIVPLPRLPSN